MRGQVAAVQASRSKARANDLPWSPSQPLAGIAGHPAQQRSASILGRLRCLNQEPAAIEFGRLEVSVYSTSPTVARSVCRRPSLDLKTLRELAFVCGHTDYFGFAVGAKLRFSLTCAAQLIA